MDISSNSAPLEIFEAWMKEAKAHAHIKEANAMALATQTAHGDLRVRVVLCKGWSPQGFVFYTNYNSHKGQDLDHHPVAGAVFYWDPLFRQISISGSVQKTSRAESEAYWAKRPRESQISQWVSSQSEPVASRAALDQAWLRGEEKFKNREVPCPEHWGGYLLSPKTIEFWKGRPGRLHDRYEFRKGESGWTFRRLYP